MLKTIKLSKINCVLALILLFSGTLFFTSCAPPPESNLTILENTEIRLGLLKDTGARIVTLERKGQGNILRTARDKWNTKYSEEFLEEVLDDERWFFEPYQGHEVWVSPQNKWYSQQQAIPLKKADRWPPHPAISYGPSGIVSQTKESIELLAMPCIYTGLQFTKKIKIVGSNTVEIITDALNYREDSVTWGLWSNLRLNPDATVWVPIKEKFRIIRGTGEAADGAPISLDQLDGLHFFNQNAPFKQGYSSRCGKLFSDCTEGTIIAFTPEKTCLVLRFEKVNEDRLPEGQGNVEIFWDQEKSDRREGLLELEHHGAYTTIAPGDTLRMKETWQLLEYNGDYSPADQREFIRKNNLLTKAE